MVIHNLNNTRERLANTMGIGRELTIPNLNYKELRKVCSSKPAALAKKYGLTHYNTKLGSAWFQDNGADILAVAHVDSVMPFLHFDVARMKPDTRIFCTTLDDRLGVYMLLDYLPRTDIKFDILLTDNEEIGRSSAGAFRFPHKRKYNWIFSFDRAGTDVVMYDFYDWQTASQLYKFFSSVHRGSYSCISDLEDLGCKGFNFGVGYHDHHSVYAYASRNEILMQVRRFISFYKLHNDTYFPHITKKELKYRDVYREPKLAFGKETVDLSDEYKYGEYDYPVSVKKSDFEWDDEDYMPKQGLIVAGGLVPQPIVDTSYEEVENQPLLNIRKVLGSEDKIPVVEQIQKDYEEGRATPLEKRMTDVKDKIKASVSMFLTQEIGLLNVPDTLLQVLRDNGVITIAEIASLSRVEFLNLAKITKTDADAMESALDAVSLSWGTNLQTYNLTLVPKIRNEKSSQKTLTDFEKRLLCVKNPTPLHLNGEMSPTKMSSKSFSPVHVLIPCRACKNLFKPKDMANGYEECPDCTKEKKAKGSLSDILITGGLPLPRTSKWRLQITKEGMEWVERPVTEKIKAKVVGFAGAIPAM